jgi:excisionase family DNA binding protein
MKPEANRRYLTTSEVAARLRVRAGAVRWLIRSQQLPAHRIAEEFLIEESDLAAFIKAHTFSPPPQWGGLGTEWA